MVGHSELKPDTVLVRGPCRPVWIHASATPEAREEGMLVFVLRVCARKSEIMYLSFSDLFHPAEDPIALPMLLQVERSHSFL